MYISGQFNVLLNFVHTPGIDQSNKGDMKPLESTVPVGDKDAGGDDGRIHRNSADNADKNEGLSRDEGECDLKAQQGRISSTYCHVNAQPIPNYSPAFMYD